MYIFFCISLYKSPIRRFWVFIFCFLNYFCLFKHYILYPTTLRWGLMYRYKVRFRGKGYRLFKLRRNSVIFNFGYSHILLKYFFNTQLIVQPKLHVVVLGLNFFTQRNAITTFLYVRYINIFNLRGMKILGQRYRKKDGKISQYR